MQARKPRGAREVPGMGMAVNEKEWADLGKELRLDKFLCDMGRGTRSQIKDAVRKGRVTVNRAVVKKPEQKVRIPGDEVLLDGKPVAYVSEEYYLLNKPAGVVSATEDGRYGTVIDLIGEKNRKDLFPVGRLDIDTEGLLLITNDGALAHRLLSPKRHVDKVYFARCRGRVPEAAVEEFAAGLTVDEELSCLPAKLKILGVYDGQSGQVAGERGTETADGPYTEIRLTIHEGKFHQVKRMMEAVGCPVVYLKRLSMGPLALDDGLEPGQYRPLTKEELELLKAL